MGPHGERRLLPVGGDHQDGSRRVRKLTGNRSESSFESRLSHAVTRLEKRGWLERSVGVGGRRHNVVSLSRDGAAAIRAAAPDHVANVRQLLLDPLGPGEVELLGDLLIKVLSKADPDLHAQFDNLVAETVDRNRPGGDQAS